MKNIIGFNKNDETIEFVYFACDSIEDYENGNHDVINRWNLSIDNDLVQSYDLDNEEDLKELASKYDADLSSKDIEIVYL